MDSSSLLPPSCDGDEPLCYLCLDTGVGQPLLRDCARRGTDAGFVHLSCLTKKYAAAKSMQTVEMTEFVQPWETCPGCHPILLERACSRYCPSLSRSFEGSIPTYKKAGGGSSFEVVCI